MALTTKIDVLTRTEIMTLTGTDEERSKALASFARESLAEAVAINRGATGGEPTWRTFVDGREGATEETVKPSGTIAYEFDVLSDMFAWIGEMLVRHSPVRTGRFQDSHVFFADDIEVVPGAAIPVAEEYVFVNTQPYARKIERGLSDQTPDGVYEAVAEMASNRYSNIAKFWFSYYSPILPYIKGSRNRDQRAALKGQPAKVAAMGMERASRNPAIYIKIR